MSLSPLIRTLSIAAKLAGYVAAAVVVVLLGLNLVAPRLTRTVPLTVLTGSMSPNIPAGSLVLVRPTVASDLKVGDVITFESAPGSGRYTTHRITQVHGDARALSFTTKGDANLGEDVAPVTAGAVRGRVLFHAPKVGAVGDRLRSPAVLKALIVLAFGALILSTLHERVARRRAARLPAQSAADEAVETASESPFVVRQLLLSMVTADAEARGEVAVLAHSFGGSVVGSDDERVTVMVAAAPTVLDRFEGLLTAWPDREVVRSSCVVAGAVETETGTAAEAASIEKELTAIDLMTSLEGLHHLNSAQLITASVGRESDE